MGNPEETFAVPDAETTTAMTTSEPVTEDLTGLLVGWKRKVRE